MALQVQSWFVSSFVIRSSKKNEVWNPNSGWSKSVNESAQFDDLITAVETALKSKSRRHVVIQRVTESAGDNSGNMSAQATASENKKSPGIIPGLQKLLVKLF